MDEGETVVFESDEDKRRALLAWMKRVNVDEVILEELRKRTEAGQSWFTPNVTEQANWETLRDRWQNDRDR